MKLWLYVILANAIVFILIRLFVYPRKKKLIVNPTEYEYVNKAYLYVDNKVYGNIGKRQEIDADVVVGLLNRIPLEIQHNKDLEIRNCSINSVLELQELVRRYDVCSNNNIIKQIDECLSLCDYAHICIMLEVRAILCAQR